MAADGMTGDLHSVVERRLRRADQRYTPGRRAIVDLLVSTGHPVSIGDIADRLPGLPRSSAYRHLTDLLVRLAFVGKGGSGKTTLSSLLVHHLAGAGLPVIAIDADINQHLAGALGAAGQPPAMGAHLTEIKEYLRGDNPRITSAAAMVKTTPPGRGSRLLRFGGPDPVNGLSVAAPCGARAAGARCSSARKKGR